jgi:hypothetical protein
VTEDGKFDRVGLVLEHIRQHEASGARLTPSAKYLAVHLARRSRRTHNGSWAVWRGRKSLAELTGFTDRTVNVARRELLDAGIFMHAAGETSIALPDGTHRPVARGVMVLCLVLDRAKFLAARGAKRHELDRYRREAVHGEKLNLQKRLKSFGGDIPDAEYPARLAQLERRPRGRAAV